MLSIDYGLVHYPNNPHPCNELDENNHVVYIVLIKVMVASKDFNFFGCIDFKGNKYF